MPVRTFLTRLRGIGYDGYVTVEGDAAGPEEVLREAVARLKAWSREGADVPAESDSEPAGPRRPAKKIAVRGI